MPKAKDTSPGALKGLGAQIRRLREEAGLTQAQMAAKIGRKQAWIQKIEADQRAVTVAQLIDVANLLGVFLEEIVPEKYLKKKIKNPVRTIDK